MRGWMKGVPSLKLQVARHLRETTETNDVRRALDFFNRYGTHFIQQYIAGDAVYQVLVYDAANCTEFVARLDAFDVANATNTSWVQLFTPPPFYTGRLMVHSHTNTHTHTNRILVILLHNLILIDQGLATTVN